jgi:hypothetical protein
VYFENDTDFPLLKQLILENSKSGVSAETLIGEFIGTGE